jgi:hypothetical protein
MTLSSAESRRLEAGVKPESSAGQALNPKMCQSAQPCLEDHVHGAGHRDDLRVGQAQLLVVVQHHVVGAKVEIESEV